MVKILTPGLFAGIRPARNARELNTFDLGLYGGADLRNVNARDATVGVFYPVPKPASLLPSAIQQNPLHKVLPCKGLAEAVRVGRPPKAKETEGMYPKPGVGRHQKKGLAYLAEKPTSGPLLPVASNFFPFGPSPLGQPK